MRNFCFVAGHTKIANSFWSIISNNPEIQAFAFIHSKLLTHITIRVVNTIDYLKSMSEPTPKNLRYKTKISELTQRIAEIRVASSRPSFSFSSERFEKAIQNFEILKNPSSCIGEQSAATDRHILDQLFYELYTKIAVDLDACIKPEIDPNEGWVIAQSRNFDNNQSEEFIIDTQLMTLTLRPALSGGLVEWLFKPRKLNFLHAFTDHAIIPSFVCGLCDPQKQTILFDSQSARLEVKIHTPDQVNLLTKAKVIYQDLEIIVCSEYLVKAGLGAHRQNSTTGFSYTYWLESKSALPVDHELVLLLNPMLPSRKELASDAYLLHDIGAVNTKVIQLTAPYVFPSCDYPQGIHGIRLVDTENPYAMDIRSQKPLSAIKAAPLYEKNSLAYYTGSQISFETKLSPGQFCTEKNTIFVSLI